MKGFLDKRVLGLIEVCLMVFFIAFLAWVFEAYLNWFEFFDWFFKALMVLIVLLVIILSKKSFKTYGFFPEYPSFTLKWSLLFIAIFIVPAVASIILSIVLGIATQTNVSSTSIISTIIYYMVFVGLIEEIYFRGYVQSRLNEVFEKRWQKLVFKAWRVDYGASLLITSTIFALIHLINYWNPLTSMWKPVWWMPIHILFCFIFGCIAGALREASGDIYTPASLHGGIMTAYTLLSIYTNVLTLNISLFISWFIFFWSLEPFFRKAERLKSLSLV